MGRPRKPRPELEGAVIEPELYDEDDAAEDDVEPANLSDVAASLGTVPAAHVRIRITWETPVNVEAGTSAVAPGDVAEVPRDVADLLISRGMAELAE
jgi:hypothetical protein